MIDFFIDCTPPTLTAQQKGRRVAGHRVSRGGKLRPRIIDFKKPELVALEEQFIKWFLPHAPAAPMEGPVRFKIVFIHDWPVALKKRRMRGELPPFIGKDTRPDTDNMLKLPKDVLTACKYWHDDAQVCADEPLKGWGDRPGIHVIVSQYTPDYVPPGCEEVSL